MPELKNSNAVVTSRGMFWTGWVLTGFVGFFLLVDGGARLAGFAPYVEGMTKFGYAASLAPWIGLVLLLSTVVMLIPQTAALGSILVTGYLGGATATQVRVQDAWFLFPVMLGVLSRLGLYLRDVRVRALIPFRIGYR
jgi:DoxX-like family